MLGRLIGVGTVLALGIMLAAGAGAEPPASAKAAGSKAAAPTLDPKALDILKAASARLAAARTMSFTAVATYENPSRYGPALAYVTMSEVKLQRPDKLRVVTPGDGPASEFYYDGKVMMAYSPAEDLVAVADAPPTIDAALKQAYDEAAIYFPFTDVVVADWYADIAAGVEVAFVVGRSRVVGGVETDVIAIATPHVFAQIWIGRDDKLPRRIRALYVDDPSALRHDVELANWRIDGAIPGDAFTSARATSAKRIKFARPEPQPPTEAKAAIERALKGKKGSAKKP
jgi:hypothetical protein